jgi:hypothetical protein
MHSNAHTAYLTNDALFEGEVDTKQRIEHETAYGCIAFSSWRCCNNSLATGNNTVA